jgi:CHASE3 domain sensor protein
MPQTAGWMSNLTTSIRQSSRGLLIGLTAVGLVATAVIAGMITVVLDRNEQMDSANSWVQHTQQVIVAIDNVLANIDDIETGERGFLLTADAVFLRPYESGVAGLWDNFHKVARLVAEHPEQQRNAAKLENLTVIRPARSTSSATAPPGSRWTRCARSQQR